MEIGINFNQVTHYEEYVDEECFEIRKRKDLSLFGRDKGFVWENCSTLKSYATIQEAVDSLGDNRVFAKSGVAYYTRHVKVYLSNGKHFTKYFPYHTDMLVFINSHLSHCVKI